MKIIAILAILAVIVAVAIAIIYLMGMFEQTKPIADQAMGLGTQAVDYVKGNIPTVTAYAGTVSAAIGGVALIKKQATDKVTAVKTDAESQMTALKDNFSQEKDQITTDLTTKLDAANCKVTDAQNQLKDYKNEAQPQLAQIKTLQDQTQAVKDQNTQFITSLMQASNGALVANPMDGKIYSVLKVPPEVIIK